jgi:hypothetical protein
MSVTKGFPGRATVRNKAGRSTRKMQMSRFAAGMGIILLVLFISLTYSLVSSKIGRVYGVGVSLIIFVGVVSAIKYLEKEGNKKAGRYHDARRGAEAEEAAGQILDSLPEGFFIIHDFDSGKGNIDHIIIGPKGIFTVETKSQRGEVTFDGNQLLFNGKPFQKDFLKQAWAECYLVRDLLKKWEISEPKVEPVILFTNAFVKVREKAKGVEIVNLKYLPKFLDKLPARLTIPEAGRIYNRVNAATK